ncbi:MAG TPA: GNAT family N-acetyltransferase [Acidimicrobiales bacterium]|nr:GNAT family N-acetyltransferase [Acidimicrobiales bacterium]
MGGGPTLETARLVLRRWRDDDLECFAGLNADPAVMEHFPAPLTRRESDALAARIEEGFEHDGFGLFAVEVRGGPPFVGFVGFVGLSPATFSASFTPAVEVGWRLARAQWGHGYATEAARACLDFAFDDVGLTEVVSFTAVPNRRSRAVMERLGMHRDPDEDFDHPRVEPGHPLRRHVLYRITAAEWGEP